MLNWVHNIYSGFEIHLKANEWCPGRYYGKVEIMWTAMIFYNEQRHEGGLSDTAHFEWKEGDGEREKVSLKVSSGIRINKLIIFVSHISENVGAEFLATPKWRTLEFKTINLHLYRVVNGSRHIFIYDPNLIDDEREREKKSTTILH